MSITSKPYRLGDGACEKCIFGCGEHADGCQWRPQFVRGGATWMDIFDPDQWRIYFSDAISKDAVAFISQRKPNETESEWLKSCAIITNIGERNDNE